MSDAQPVGSDISRQASPSQYKTFNEFFTRGLRPTARPMDPDCKVVSPADGAISEVGEVCDGTLLQAKGKHYSLATLLGNEDLAHQLDGGTFATIYLSPSDYHRVHMPIEGEPIDMQYIPGKLFSVNPRTAANVDELFARNERLVTTFKRDDETFALVMVGAMIVAGMETVLTGKIKRSKSVRSIDFKRPDEHVISKGAEFGRFYMGSTVIGVFPKSMNLSFAESVAAGRTIRVRETLAH